jgi:hypothetical protein
MTDKHERYLERAACVAMLVLGDIAIAFAAAPPNARCSLFLHLMLGPFQGWFMAVKTHAFPGALGLLLPASMVTLPSLWLYFARGSRAALLWGSLCWFASGWLFSIGIWV